MWKLFLKMKWSRKENDVGNEPNWNIVCACVYGSTH
jgi:hypothetical protein